MQEVELKATQTLLDKGVPVHFATPLFIKLFGVKRITVAVRNPTINTYAACLEYYLKMGLTPEQSTSMDFNELLAICSAKSYLASRLVARAILNSTLLGWLFTKPLGWYIKRKASFKDLLKVAEIIVIQGGIEDFTNFIGLAQKMNISSQTSQQISPTS